jgi:hypothetical protein
MADQEPTGVAFTRLQRTRGRRSTDDPIMTTTSVAISNLLQRIVRRRHRVGERTEHAIFSLLALLRQNMRRANPLAPTNPATVEIGKEGGMGEAASQPAEVAFGEHAGDVGRWDRIVRKTRGKVAIVRHLRPSLEQATGGPERRTLRPRHCRAPGSQL